MENAVERILWFTAGAGVGAGVIFLFGTKKGQRYRRQLTRMVEDGCEQVAEAGRDALNKGMEALESGREVLQEAGSRIGRQLRFARR